MMASRKPWRLFLTGCAVLRTGLAFAHPHVFVDGGVDFVMGAENSLKALHVTWRYDAFETLYILSSHGLKLNDKGELDEASRQTLVRLRSQFPDDFDGSAHLSVDDQLVPLKWPDDFDAHIVGDQLEVTFTRGLETPLDVTQGSINVAFYESTYFFAFSATDTPKVLGPSTCETTVVQFKANPEDTALLETLAKLGREETSGLADVGAIFADRIALRCG